ncbi:unnamed protein product [Rotaria magnacalcarata]|uniref:BEN domain-containing protein n=1 Tax=Rotaria magnacalcarata TaxID=392030 RepID=A0A814WKW7_9BILA|nr:unnamed protein product [Rotaria magnacalcarata]
MTSRRQTFPRRVFTPTQHTPPSTHYLLLFEETNSYQIVARSSLKNINDDVTFILIRNKLLQAKIVFHGLLSYLFIYLFIYFILAYCLSGSLEDCNSEYARLTRLSQDQADDQNDGNILASCFKLIHAMIFILSDDSIQDAINMINSSMKNIRSSKIDRTRLSSSTSSSPRISTCAQTPEKIDVEVSDSDDEENSFFDCRKRTKKTLFESSSKKRRSTIGKPLTQRVSTASNDENSTITMSNKNKSNIQSESNVLQDIDNRVNQLNEKLISNSSKFDQLMQKLYVKIDRLTSNINVHKHALEPYVDKTGETFPDVLMFNNYNLLDLMATDYGNYARKILRIVFSQDELKSSILPPGKPHLRRQPLDQDRFKICMDAIRYKFKLDAVNFGLFYRALLRRKLTDFLIEERRRQST